MSDIIEFLHESADCFCLLLWIVAIRLTSSDEEELQ